MIAFLQRLSCSTRVKRTIDWIWS